MNMISILRFPTLLLLISLPLLAREPAHALPVPALPENAQASGPRFNLVGYYPGWGIDSSPAYNVKNVITSGSAPLLTHLIYESSSINDLKCASGNPGEDYAIPLPAGQTVDGKPDSTAPGAFTGNFHQLKELKARYPKLSILIDIAPGGLGPPLFSTAAKPANRKAFVASCIDMYIKGRFAYGIVEPGIFTGMNIDWEFPASAADRANYVALLEEFRRQLDALGPGYVLSSISPVSSPDLDYMDLNAAQSFVDFFNVLTFDFDGWWKKRTGFVAPLYKAKLDSQPKNNIDFVLRSMIETGVERSKIVVGTPSHAYHWTHVLPLHAGLYQLGVGDSNGYDPYQYRYVETLKGYTKYRDPVTQEPWLYHSGSFWTYDDPASLQFKTKYVVENGLGGVMFWDLSGDTANGALIKALAGNQ